MHRRSFLGCLATAAIAGCQSSDVEAEFEVPEAVLVDERFDVVLTGAPADRPVRVTARADDGRSMTPPWSASATFQSDGDGTVNLAEQPPVSGSYEGVDPMGLFWSMRTDAPPAEAFFPPRDHEVALTASVDGDAVATATVQRRLAVEGVEATPLDDLVGTLFTPPGDGPAPAVLLLAGSSGRELTARAQLLASRGFLAGTLRYFGRPDSLPDVLADVPIEYVQRAVGLLSDHPRAADRQVAVWGISKGAELALLLGSHDDRVGAVVGLSPGTVVWEGFDDDGVPAGTSSWTIDGEPVPYIRLADFEDVPGDPTESPRRLYEYSELRADPERVAAATIPVERIRGPVQLFSGTNDNQWHSTAMGDRTVDRLADRDHPFPYAHHSFEGAGHSMPLPYLPTYGSSASPSYPLGGDPVANARASREHWAGAVETLADTIDGFDASSPNAQPETSAPSSTGESGGDSAPLVGAVGVAVATLAAVFALGRRALDSSSHDGPDSIYRRTARWAWTRDESDRSVSRNTVLFTAVIYVTALVLVGLAGALLGFLGYRSAAVSTWVFGIWFTTFIGSINVGWELLQLWSTGRTESPDERAEGDPGRELAPNVRLSRDTKIGLVVTVLALLVLIASFRIAVRLAASF